MIKYLQKLKYRKGFTMLELIVTVAIIGILLAVILLSADNTSARIKAANSAAQDLYVSVQSAFTRYMVYDGPLSPTFRDDPDTPYMKYYRVACGNYPYSAGTGESDYPKPCDLYLEIYAKNGKIEYVNCSNEFVGGSGALIGQSANTSSEFGRVLAMELGKRVDYQDGYYYAHISCNPTYDAISGDVTEMDTVRVEYTAYTQKRIISDMAGTYYNFGDRDYVLINGEVCGVAAPLSEVGGTTIMIGRANTTLAG